jgi:hypothetical protein
MYVGCVGGEGMGMRLLVCAKFKQRKEGRCIQVQRMTGDHLNTRSGDCPMRAANGSMV